MTDRVRVGLVVEGFFDIPVWAGIDRGTFGAAGLDVEAVVLGGIDPLTEALHAGDVQVAVGAPEHVIRDVECGGSLRMVGGNLNRLTHSMIVRPGINRLEDLRGRTIGVSALSAGTSSLWRSMLADVGLHYPYDYSMVEAGPVPPRHDKLLTGEIDAAMQTDPHNYIAEDAGLDNLGSVLDWIPFFQFTSINVDERWAASHSALLTKFLAVMVRMSDWMYSHREEAVDLAARRITVERHYLDRAWQDHIDTGALPRDLRLQRASIDTTAAMMRSSRSDELGLAPDSTADQYVNTDYLLAAQRGLGLREVGLV